MATKEIKEQWEFELFLDELQQGITTSHSVILQNPADGYYLINSPVSIDCSNYHLRFMGASGRVPIAFSGKGSLTITNANTFSLRSVQLLAAVANTITVTATNCVAVDLYDVDHISEAKGVQPFLIKDSGTVGLVHSYIRFANGDTSGRGIVTGRCKHVVIDGTIFKEGGSAVTIENCETIWVKSCECRGVYVPIAFTGEIVSDENTEPNILAVTNSKIIQERFGVPMIKIKGDGVINLSNGSYGTTSAGSAVVEGTDGTEVHLIIDGSSVHGRLFKDSDPDSDRYVDIQAYYSDLSYSVDSEDYMIEHKCADIELVNCTINAGRFMNVSGNSVILRNSIINLTCNTEVRLVNYIESAGVNLSNNRFKFINPNHFKVIGDHGIYINNYFDLSGTAPKDDLISVLGEGNSFSGNHTSSNIPVGGETA